MELIPPEDVTTRLALAARDGDRTALDGFVRSTQVDVWRCCAHLVAPDAADDLTQETYLRLVKALRTYRGDASGRTFALSIARRVCADEIRRRTRQRALGQRLARRRVDLRVPDPGGAADLDALVAALEPDRRAAFVLTQVLGLSYEQTAQVCGCPIGTIRSRVARARTDLLAATADVDGETGSG